MAIVLTVIYSFNGVVLSAIIVNAGKFTDKSTIQDITIFGVVSLSAWALIYLANFLLTRTEADIIREINIEVRQKYFWHEFQKTYEHKQSSDVISRLNNDIKLIEGNYFQQEFALITNILLVITSLLYMLYLNVVVSLIFIFFSFLPMIVPKIFSKRLRNSTNDWSNRNEDYTKNIQETLQGSNVLKTYQVLKLTFARIFESTKGLELAYFKLNVNQGLAQLMAALFSGISFIAPFIIGCYLITVTGSLNISVLIALFLANDRVVGPLREVASSISVINSTQELRKRIFIEDGAQGPDDPSSGELISKLVVEDVSYQVNDSLILHLNRSFLNTDKVLIIGESGSGKTTILNLLREVLKPDKGIVYALNKSGNRIKNISSETAYISQVPFIFNATLRDNITLFDSQYLDTELVDVLKTLSLYQELGGEKALDLECGEGGSNLSGGQRQRIEIARAILRKRQFYLADEVTANLDQDNSKLIRDILFSLKVPLIEVAHHYDVNDERYTQILRVNKGELEKWR
ncbi:MAG: ABC transporter ATP-binding protein/permease [Lactobacillus sp.]|nr:ABC transporter ATP-binding protein/permease [Lactobacillus sp.]